LLGLTILRLFCTVRNSDTLVALPLLAPVPPVAPAFLLDKQPLMFLGHPSGRQLYERTVKVVRSRLNQGLKYLNCLCRVILFSSPFFPTRSPAPPCVTGLSQYLPFLTDHFCKRFRERTVCDTDFVVLDTPSPAPVPLKIVSFILSHSSVYLCSPIGGPFPLFPYITSPTVLYRYDFVCRQRSFLFFLFPLSQMCRWNLYFIVVFFSIPRLPSNTPLIFLLHGFPSLVVVALPRTSFDLSSLLSN